MKKLLIAASLALLPLHVCLADDTVAPAESFAPPTCKKPILPSSVRRADDTGEFMDKYEQYRQCIKDYADAHAAAAKKHTEVANAAIQEVNDFAAQINARQAEKDK